MRSLYKAIIAIFFLAPAFGTLYADFFYYPFEFEKQQNDIYALSVEKNILERQLAEAKKDSAFQKNQYEEKIRNLESRIAALTDTLRETQNALRDERRSHVEDNAYNTLKIDEKERQIRTLKKESTAAQKKLAEESAAQEKKYLSEIEKLKKELEQNREEYRKELAQLTGQKNERIAELEKALSEKSRELAQCIDLAKQQKQTVSELENQAKELEQKLQKEIAEGNLRIKRYKDRIVINIDDKILFPSGSASLRREVRATLNTVAEMLVKNTSSRVLIEGHTDNVPIRTPRFPDNWELSSARALSVLRNLLTNKNLDPSRFGAAGYGEFRPVAPNDTAANRQFNRRVDIVLQLANTGEAK
ncbi:MAG TPA: OmpA family protein [Turneriella sp.]|nr:OmpA family protein [Turneriella sp.]